MKEKPINKRSIGTAYEKLAGEYLKRQGYEIIEYNFRCHIGEIDLIAKDGDYLVFIEVKYRSGNQTGNPLEAVTRSKQRTISKVALFYLMTHGYGEDTCCRFDVVAILGDKIRLVRNAFDYAGR